MLYFNDNIMVILVLYFVWYGTFSEQGVVEEQQDNVECDKAIFIRSKRKFRFEIHKTFLRE